jgi:glucose/arabinose dehydrogenase
MGNTNEVVRFPYHNGDLKASGPPQHIADLPDGGGHWTRAVEFSSDGKKCLSPLAPHRTSTIPIPLPGEKSRRYSGVRSPELRAERLRLRHSQSGGGIAVNPKTGELWCSVNERDALGDNLVPDYITHVQEGGFYGWPWWYIGGHQDPRHEGQASRAEGQSDRPRRAPAAAQRLAGVDFLRRQAIPGRSIRETFSPPSTAPGTKRCAWATK